MLEKLDRMQRTKKWQLPADPGAVRNPELRRRGLARSRPRARPISPPSAPELAPELARPR